MLRLHILILLLCFTFLSKAQIRLQDSLIAYLPMNGHGLDLSGRNNHATISVAGAYAASNQAAMPAQAMMFNGAIEQGQLEFGTSLLNNNPNFSMSFWFNASSLTNGMSLVGQDNLLEVGFFTSPTRLSIFHPTSGSFNVNLSNGANVWQHVVVTCSPLQIRIFINGTLAHTINGNYSLGATSFPTRIGGNVINQSNNSWFRGSIDEVRLYNRILSSDEIQLLSSSGSQTMSLQTINSNWCQGQTIQVPYTILGSFDSTNVFSLQLSDANGSFTDALVLATHVGFQSDTITFTVPAHLLTGSAYKLRLVSSLPLRTGTITTQSFQVSNPTQSLSRTQIGRMAWYRFNGNVADSSGNGQHATTGGGVSYVTDRHGNSFGAIELNGTSGFVQAPAGVWFNGGPYTVSCWVRPNSATNWARIYDFGNGNANDNILATLFQTLNNRQQVEHYLGTSSAGFAITNTPGLRMGQWNHFLSQYDGTTLRVYINGMLVASSVITAPRMVRRTLCYIGRSNWVGDAFANAAFDDFIIYNRALSENEISVLANDAGIFSNGTPCTGSSLQLRAPTIPGATYQWTGPNGFSSNLQNVTIDTATSINAGVYQLIIRIGTCDSALFTRTISVPTATGLPTVSFTSLPSTLNTGSSAVSLTATPVGGIFTGNGLEGNIFSPTIAGIGTHKIVYSVTHTTGCVATAQQSTKVFEGYNISSGTTIACNGGFYDQGGSSGNYLPNQNRIQTFCSGDTANRMRFQFTNFGIGAGDTLLVYDGADTAAYLIGYYIQGSAGDVIWSSGSCITFQFKSNATAEGSGWLSSFTCMPNPSVTNEIVNLNAGMQQTCSMTLRDPGGTGNYGYGWWSQTFRATPGNRLRFNRTFMAIAGSNGGHWLRIYDGPNTSFPMIGQVNNFNWMPTEIESTGEYLTFVFDANNTNAGTNSGFEGILSCGTPVLPVFVMGQSNPKSCVGVLTDNGGLGANYTNNTSLTQTITSANATKLRIEFNRFETDLNTGDTLFVFDGNDTLASPLAAFVQGSAFESMKSKDSALTFQFKSNVTTNARGWQGFINCVPSHGLRDTFSLSSGIRYTDSAIVYDPGGTGNYSLGFWRQTFGSYNGNRLRIQFTELNVNGNNGGHWVRVYDGPNTSFPLIGSFNEWAWPSGPILSTGRFITIEFDANNNMAGTRPGFTATLASTTPLPALINMSNTPQTNVCNAVFYDNGGASTNYTDNQYTVQTLCADSGQMLRVRFNHVTTQLAAGDTLRVFDGTDTTTNPIAVHVAGSVLDVMYASARCLTFIFSSNNSTNGRGWQGFLTCDTLPKPQEVFALSAGTRYTCDAIIRDPGGTGNYGLGFWRQTFGSNNGNRLQLQFSELNVNGNNGGHWVRVFDGPDASYPLLGSFNEWAWPSGPIVSSSGFLTIEFDANNTSASGRPGFTALLSCTTPLPTVVNMQNGSTTTCDGVFYDNGSANANYTNNASLTQTICADSGQLIRIRFNHLQTQLGAGDTLFVYEGASVSQRLVATFIEGSRFDPLFASGRCLTFLFRSNASVNARGWQGFITCDTIPQSRDTINLSAGTRFICNTLVRDPGGASDYGYGFWRQTFGSADSSRLLMSFSQLNVNGNNGGHWVTVFDGPNQNFPIIGSFNEWNWPSGEIRSSGRFLTVEFNSSNTSAGTRPGFTANIVCADPIPLTFNMSGANVQTCNAIQYDNGGPSANYPNNQYIAQTICGDSAKYLNIAFRRNVSRLASGDTLIVYDGTDTLAQRLAVFYAGSSFDSLTAISNCLTLLFKSDATNNEIGWQSFLQCDTVARSVERINLNRGTRYTCNAVIRDNGGTGDYPRGTDALYVQTFGSYNENRLQLQFTEFNINSTNSVHWLRIYDGPSTAFPLIGSYNNSTGSPGIITSSGRYLTIEMDTRNTGASAAAGFTANLSCITPVLPTILMSNNTRSIVCEGVFYDNGGPAANYASSTNHIHTLTSANNQHVQIVFNRNHTEFAAGDTLFIYDGDSISSPLLGTYVAGSTLETITSSSRSLTFRFQTDATAQGRGWQGFISCVNAPQPSTTFVMSAGSRHTCNAVFLDPGGTGNYPQGTWIQTFRSYNGTRIRAVRQTFSLSTASGGHWLDVYDGPAITSPLIGSYNNSNPPPVAFQSTGNALTFRLRATASTATAAGWDYRLSCFSGNTIDVDWLTSPVCRGRTIPVSFTRFVSVDSTNIYSVQLSDSTGNFSSPVTIGTLASRDSIGTIVASIPTGTPAASGYRIRIVSSSPVVLGNASPNTLTILAAPVQPVITLTGPSAFCNGVGTATLSIPNQPGMNYRWTRNDTTVGTNATTLPVTQSGSYRVIVSNGCDTIVSTQIVTILAITTPQRQTVTASGDTNICSNAQVVLSVPAQVGVNYQWFRNDTALTSTNNRIFTTQTTGLYRVQMSNTCGNATSFNSMQVTVVAQPPIAPVISAASATSFCNGDSALLSVTQQPGVTYSWRRNNIAIGQDTNFIWAKQSGTYSVIATNQCASVNSSNTQTVNILAPTIVNSISANDTLCPGSNKTISVSASGSGTITYQWFRNGTLLTGRTQPTLSINGFSSTDTGWYRVRVTAQCGVVFSDSIKLSLRKPGLWLGTANNNWANPANWNCPIIPDSTIDVEVPASSLFMPFVFGHQHVRNLHIHSGTFVNITDSLSSLTLYGQVSGGGRINHTAGTFVLQGNLPQTLAGGTYHKIRINNPVGISLLGDVILKDSLQLQQGVLALHQYNLTLQANRGSITGFSPTRYVILNSTGALRYTHMGTSGQTAHVWVPIGNSTFNPIRFQYAGVLDTFTFRLIDAVHATYTGFTPLGVPITTGAVQRTWFIHASNIVSANAQVELFWNAGNELGGFNRSNSYMAQHNGSTWIPATASGLATGSNPYSIVRSGLTTFNTPFGIGSGTTLPVSLLRFDAKLQQPRYVALEWETIQEINNRYFTLERSADMQNFETIAKVSAASTRGALYTWTDNLQTTTTANQTWYYRLSQTDMDGTKQDLGIRAITVSSNNEQIHVQPNPFDNFFDIELSDIGDASDIKVYNAIGQLVHTFTVTAPKIRIATEMWASGVYYIRCGNASVKVVKAEK
jgi:hypothetical protein